MNAKVAKTESAFGVLSRRSEGVCCRMFLRPLLNLIESMKDLTQVIAVLITGVNRLIVEIRDLRKVIQMRKPGLVFSKMISEGMNGMSKFALILPPPGAADVVTREVVYSINDGAPVTLTLPGTARETEPFEAEEGQVVTGTLVDIDDANPANRSEPRTFNLSLADTLAPPQPGEVGVRMTEDGPAPTPTPTPTPEPTPQP